MTHKIYEVRLNPGPDNSAQQQIQDVLDKVDADGGEVVAEVVINGKLFITAKLP